MPLLNADRKNQAESEPFGKTLAYALDEIVSLAAIVAIFASVGFVFFAVYRFITG